MLQQLSVWSVTLPFLAGLFRWRSLAGVRAAAWALTAAALFPQLIRFVIRERSVENALYNAYTIVEYTIMTVLLYRLAGCRHKHVFSLLTAGFIGYAAGLYTRQSVTARFWYEMACYDNLVYTGLILWIIYRQMDAQRFVLRRHDEAFWFVASILVYAPVSLFALSLWPWMGMPDPPLVVRAAKMVNDVANTILYLGFTIGLCATSEAVPVNTLKHDI